MVRSFPLPARHRRQLRRGAMAVVLVTMLSLVAAVLSSASADNLGDRKRDVEKKLSKADQHLDESSEALQSATAALLRARDELYAAQSHLAQTQDELGDAVALDELMQARLEAAVERLRKARADLSQGRADIDVQTNALRRVVVANYQSGDPSLMGLSMVFTTQDPAQLAGTMNASRTVANKESTVLNRLEASKVLLTVRESETEAAKVAVADRRKEAAENLVLKRALEEQARVAEAQVTELVGLRADARDNAKKAKRSDLAELAKLEAERDRIEKMILAQASVGRGFNGPVGNGFLDRPVPGAITSGYGYRIHPIYGYRSLHDGVDIGAGCGTPIRAAAPGKVLQEYFQTAWGNRIIIDHGVKYGAGVATISNHLSSYAVSVGQRVSRGQVIGYVGSTGWSTGCHLHFTVLANGSAVDPMIWF